MSPHARRRATHIRCCCCGPQMKVLVGTTTAMRMVLSSARGSEGSLLGVSCVLPLRLAPPSALVPGCPRSSCSFAAHRGSDSSSMTGWQPLSPSKSWSAPRGTHKLTHSCTHTLTHSHSHSCTPHTHCHTRTRAHTRAHTHTHTHTHTRARSLFRRVRQTRTQNKASAGARFGATHGSAPRGHPALLA